MPVSVRAVRANYAFVDGGPLDPAQAFRAFSSQLRERLSADDAVSVSLSKSGVSLSAATTDESDTISPKRSSGAVGAFFDEVKSVGKRISALQRELESVSPGSSREKALREELAYEQASYQELMNGETFKRLGEVLQHVEQALARGVAPGDLAKLLQGQRSLFGNDFLGVIQQGDLAGIYKLRDGVTALGTLDITSPVAGITLQGIGESALSALAGKSYQEAKAAPAPPVTTVEESVFPVLEQIKLDIPGDVSFALNSVTGKDIAKAIEAHAFPDQRYALMLVLDDGKDVSSEEEKKRIEEERRLREEQEFNSLAYTYPSF